MRIGVDAREICGKPTGVGRYLSGLLSQWAILPETRRHQFVLFAPQVPPAWVPDSKFELHILPGCSGTRWEQFTLGRAVNHVRPDVFFAPAYSAPLTVSIPIVLTMHDVSFIAHPEWFRWRERFRRTWIARRSVHKSRIVLTVSEHMRGEIVFHLRVPLSRIRVILHGVTVPGLATPAEQASATREPMVLFAGSIFNRRHVPDLVHAFSQVAHRHPQARLEIVGENRTHPHQDLGALVTNLNLQQQVQIRSYESDDVLNRLYRKARVFAFLSEYEGFGLPPLEALAAGVPAVVTDTPVARELCGGAALYVASGDLDGIARNLEALLFDSQARRHILDRAPAVLARYSWERAARETLAALEEAALSNPQSRTANPENRA